MPISTRSSLVAIASLTLLACRTHSGPTVNPPPPEPPEPLEQQPSINPTPPEPISINPPPPELEQRPININPPSPHLPPVPTWDEVASTHPEGATNPPVPLLAVTADGKTCFKEWRDMRAVPPEIGRAGGRVLAVGETSEDGTEIVCPADRAARVLGAQKTP